MKIFHSDAHHLHDVPFEFNRGRMVAAYERPSRVDGIIDQLRATELGPIEAPREFSLEQAYAVHDRALVDFLRNAHDEWTAQGREGLLQPIAAPIRTLRNDRVPHSIDGQISYYCFDNCTAITAGTWQAVKASYDIALSAADHVATGRSRAAFGLCRPPGHHAARTYYGGYCFLNNAAAAAQYLRDHGASRVTILDVDYHHGNGTQDIFYDRSDVQFISIHADPSTDFPYFLGYADEIGRNDGVGFNVNLPLSRGAAWAQWRVAFDEACARVRAFAPDVLVVSLGVDTFKGDPLSAFQLESDDFRRLGAGIAALELPTVYIMEGGYAIEDIGVNVTNTLHGHGQRVQE